MSALEVFALEVFALEAIDLEFDSKSGHTKDKQLVFTAFYLALGIKDGCEVKVGKFACCILEK